MVRLKETEDKRTSLTEEAAAWFLRIQNDEVSDKDFADWREWVSQSTAHARAFDDVASFWKKSEAMTDLPWPSDKDLARDKYDGGKVIQSRDEKSTREGAARRWVLGGMAAALALVVAGAVFGLMFSSPFTNASPRYETATGEHRTIYLEDGTKIMMGAMSRITVNYTDERRAVTLDYGESYFEVAKNPERPFVVTAGPRTVRAVGTAFNVKMGVRDVTVTVVEGQVQVGSAALQSKAFDGETLESSEAEELAQPRVSVGQGINYQTSGLLGEVHEVDADLAISWRKGRLAFSNQSLEAVIADVNRYSPDKIMIGDAMVKQLMFTGTVFQDEIENWLEGLEKVFPVRVIEAGDRVVIIITKYDS